MGAPRPANPALQQYLQHSREIEFDRLLWGLQMRCKIYSFLFQCRKWHTLMLNAVLLLGTAREEQKERGMKIRSNKREHIKDQSDSETVTAPVRDKEVISGNK